MAGKHARWDAAPEGSNLPPTAPLDDTEPSVIPRTVKREDVVAALEPLLQLLGIPADSDESRLFPGLVIDLDDITVTLAGHVITAAAARSVIVGDDPRYSEWATEVRVGIS